MKRFAASALSGWLLCLPALAPAQETKADPKADAKTIQALEKRLADQEKRLADLERQLSDNRLSQAQRDEIVKLVKELNADAAKQSALPGWMKDLNFAGDLRLRYQGQCFNDDTKTRNRGRFRLRFGLDKKFLDGDMEVGFRLASGETRSVGRISGGQFAGGPIGQDPTHTNQSFTDNFSRKPIWIDLAYARYSPKEIKGLSGVVGKMLTPMVHTDMMWDADLNPEGVYAQYKAPLGSFQPFIGSGYFVAQESAAGHDAVLAAYQTGFDWDIARTLRGGQKPDPNQKTFGTLLWTSALTYYDWDHLDAAFAPGTTNAVNLGNPTLNNVLTAGQFQILNFTQKFAFDVCGIDVAPFFDFAHNCGDEDTSEEFDNQDNAYNVGFIVGRNKKQGDLSFGYRYAYIEANAVPGAFTESDFGGANRKGHVWRVVYNLADFLTVGATLFWTEPIAGPLEDQRRADLRADMIWKF